MNLAEAKEKYKDQIDQSILDGYEDADLFIYINDSDEDLQKWRIQMPEPPDWELIDGFGLPAREQKFQYEKNPAELSELEDNLRAELMRNKKDTESPHWVERNFQERMWNILDVGRDIHKDLIDWIKLQWFYRIYGKWVFLKGKPHYLDGWHFFYLNYYKMEGGTDNDGSPGYRWRDYKWFHAVRYAAITTETVVTRKVEIDGETMNEVVLLEDGTPMMRDLGNRTVLGANCLKGRRVGDSSKTQCINIELATSNIESMNGLQADTEDNARGLYSKLCRYSYHKLPFFFTPKAPNLNTAKEITLNDKNMRDGLNSFMGYRASGETAYDGSRINFYQGDEIGKTKTVDITTRHDIVARTLTPGVKVKGLMIYTSTAEEMDADVGKNFEDFTMDSMFENRGIDGRTPTGLINIYFSVEESYEGFIDPWGYPVIENPTDPDVIDNLAFIEKNNAGEIMGVREYLEAKEREYIERDDLVKLSSFQRKNPKKFRECFSNAAHNLMYDRAKLQATLAKIKYDAKNKCIKGNFIRQGDVVEFHPTEQGRFITSMRLQSGRHSRMRSDGVTYGPAFDNVFVASSDTYRVSQTDARRKSLGSGAVLWKHDSTIDGKDKPVRDWDSKKFVCTYLYRPKTLDEYCQDMLNMCIYYGAMMYPENNITNVSDYFIRTGYGGYLLYDIDIKTGKKKANAGFTVAGAGGGAKQDLFNIGADWVNLHSERCDHSEILEEFLYIKDLDDMKNRDLFVSVCGCLKAEQSVMLDRTRKFNTVKYDISKLYPKR
jgi:hypothetical protein